MANCVATVCLSVTSISTDITGTATKTLTRKVKEISPNNTFYVYAGPCYLQVWKMQQHFG